jgi:hypothetical protein
MSEKLFEEEKNDLRGRGHERFIDDIKDINY